MYIPWQVIEREGCRVFRKVMRSLSLSFCFFHHGSDRKWVPYLGHWEKTWEQV